MFPAGKLNTDSPLLSVDGAEENLCRLRLRRYRQIWSRENIRGKISTFGRDPPPFAIDIRHLWKIQHSSLEK